jgi:hypothetical protein
LRRSDKEVSKGGKVEELMAVYDKAFRLAYAGYDYRTLRRLGFIAERSPVPIFSSTSPPKLDSPSILLSSCSSIKHSPVGCEVGRADGYCLRLRNSSPQASVFLSSLQALRKTAKIGNSCVTHKLFYLSFAWEGETRLPPQTHTQPRNGWEMKRMMVTRTLTCPLGGER